jgi:SAM-dependent methyltransferase
MKDIVANRTRISLGRKLRLAWLALRENGLWWCLLLFTYYSASTVADRAFARMDRVRRARNVPGLNSATLNKEIWEAWNWSAEGDEWTHSEPWKQSLIRCVLETEIPRNASVLEIGPGGGRWTEPLLRHAGAYVGIDISSTCVEHCRKRFGTDGRAQFFVGSGRDLAQVADASVDAIWSFDVFVHINGAEVQAYLKEFCRVLKPSGVAVIHHGSVGGASGGWRSNLTLSALQSMLAGSDLRIVKSIDQWDDGTAVQHLRYDDLITVFAKA